MCISILELEIQGGRFFFSAVKEGDSIMFACDEEVDRQFWVQAIYRATGQSHKPVPPTQLAGGKGSNAIISRQQGGKWQSINQIGYLIAIIH